MEKSQSARSFGGWSAIPVQIVSGAEAPRGVRGLPATTSPHLPQPEKGNRSQENRSRLGDRRRRQRGAARLLLLLRLPPPRSGTNLLPSSHDRRGPPSAASRLRGALVSRAAASLPGFAILRLRLRLQNQARGWRGLDSEDFFQRLLQRVRARAWAAVDRRPAGTRRSAQPAGV